jgi:hypothetical protein
MHKSQAIALKTPFPSQELPWSLGELSFSKPRLVIDTETASLTNQSIFMFQPPRERKDPLSSFS